MTIGTNFLTSITKAVNKMAFGGATYSQGGLLDGQSQINSVAVAAGGKRRQSGGLFYRRLG